MKPTTYKLRTWQCAAWSRLSHTSCDIGSWVHNNSKAIISIRKSMILQWWDCSSATLPTINLIQNHLNLNHVLRHYFIIPNWCTQLQNHRNIKTIKILTIALTCFGSRRNHLQGAVSCLAKTTYDSMCSSLLTWSMSWRHTSLLCNC